jgi:FAD:protein FMN transferase
VVQGEVDVIHTRSFRCMTTGIELLVDATNDTAASAAVEAALAGAEAYFQSIEARFSRFRPDSELSQLNADPADNQHVPVSDDLAELIWLAKAAAENSSGVFDPTILDALEAAGYDRSIDTIRAAGTMVRTARAAGHSFRWRSVQVAQTAHDGWMVTRPAGLRLDLGGIAKGWAADQAAALLRPLGDGLVNAGGDLRAWGTQPGALPGQGWLVAVDHPEHPGDDAAWLHVVDGAAATSSVVTRRWAGGHHLIDPRTGRPAETDLLSVTALAPRAVQAEVMAKVGLILGVDAGLAWLETQPGIEALLAGADGRYYGTPGIEDYLYQENSVASV